MGFLYRATGLPLENTQPEMPFETPCRCQKERSMPDVIMIALGFGLFAATLGYPYACDQL